MSTTAWSILATGAVTLGTSVVVQLLTAHLVRRREREARLFDARRQVYAEALREIGQRMHAPIEETVPVTVDDIRALRSYMLGSEMHLLASPPAREMFIELAGPLHRALQAQSDGDLDEAQRLVREVVQTTARLRNIMNSDLGISDGKRTPAPAQPDWPLLLKRSKQGRWRTLPRLMWRVLRRFRGR